MSLMMESPERIETESMQQHQQHEPERPEVYEPPDLLGRKHVEKVAGQYRVREDGCLADKLQTEEFELHFGKNKDERHRGQIDVKEAKRIYLREVEDSGLLSKNELTQLCRDDRFLAAEVDRRLTEEKEMEAQRKTASEMQDEEFARYLEAKEKEKLELERKRRLERRIAQDRAAAEKLQRDLDKRESRKEDEISRGMHDLEVTPSKGGWAIDFEAGASSGARTKHDLQELKDAEVARSIQLKETELEQKRLEEERDRKIALKLQRQEAERYRREKEERDLRRRERAESQKRHPSSSEEQVENEVNPSVRKKQLQSVDATGKPVHEFDPAIYASERNGNTPQRHGSNERKDNPQRRESFERQGNTPQRHGSSERQHKHTHRSHDTHPREQEYNKRVNGESRMKNGEPIYLQAVDAAGRSVEQPRTSGASSRNSDTRQQPRSESVRSRDNEMRLVDEQRHLRQQMAQVKQIGNQDQSRGSNRHSSKKADNSWGLEVNTQNRKTEVEYDTPENHHYKNVAASIDPTYSSIDSLKRTNNEAVDEYGNIRAAPVIQNIRRQPDDAKKKKKWFSKKEKS